MSKLKQLAKYGQSIWLDYIRHSFINNGELSALIDKGLSGVTSNPSIFEKAITGSSDYDRQLRELIQQHNSVDAIYEAVVFEDIRTVAEMLKPVYEKTGGIDGYVSLEVDPEIANDTGKTIEEGKRLFRSLNLPNIMIKVPATPAGIPAIERLISEGVNVNVTLIFGYNQYQHVASAFLNGKENLAMNGPADEYGLQVNEISSVASFFISRLDNAVDKELERSGNKELQGKIAIANAKVAYQQFQNFFMSQRWDNLSKQGAKPQRLLWASTGTKNPAYPDTLYVDSLIGPYTVNTVPLDTLNKFLDHGSVDQTLTYDVGKAHKQLEKLSQSGIDLQKITDDLLDRGVEVFAESFRSLKQSIAEKCERLSSNA